MTPRDKDSKTHNDEINGNLIFFKQKAQIEDKKKIDREIERERELKHILDGEYLISWIDRHTDV